MDNICVEGMGEEEEARRIRRSLFEVRVMKPWLRKIKLLPALRRKALRSLFRLLFQLLTFFECVIAGLNRPIKSFWYGQGNNHASTERAADRSILHHVNEELGKLLCVLILASDSF